MRSAPFLLLLAAGGMIGQTREETLEQQRREHAAHLSPERVSRAEEWVRRIKDEKLLTRVNYGYNGLGAKLGGLVNGGGFAIGPQYIRDDFRNGTFRVHAAAQVSTRKHHKAEAAFLLPELADGKLALDVRGSYRNHPDLNYYGPSSHSPMTSTPFRLEEFSIDGSVALLPTRFIRLGTAAGMLATKVGHDTDDGSVSTEHACTPTQGMSLDQQTTFLRYGGFAQLDYRDDAFGPRSGGNYVVRYNRYKDRLLGRHSFGMLDIDVQQYISIFNKSRGFAFRAHGRLTDSGSGQTIPFYLQPVIGGSDDMRGFPAFRFSGRNSFIINGEYRWAVFSGLDGAVFMDAGKTFARRGLLNFNHLKASSGFGLRFNARDRTFLRFDVGFGHEGFQVWLKFGDVFVQRPLGTADSQPFL